MISVSGESGQEPTAREFQAKRFIHVHHGDRSVHCYDTVGRVAGKGLGQNGSFTFITGMPGHFKVFHMGPAEEEFK